MDENTTFVKYHGLGNDYFVLDPKNKPTMFEPKEIERICDRNLGLGSDGILYGPLPTSDGDFRLEIWNIDGSEAEKSGNGLRIFARYLFDQKKVQCEEHFTVVTKGGNVRCIVKENGATITIDMGKASFLSTDIPVNGSVREVLDEEIDVLGKQYRFYSVTVGNPHVVIPVESLDKLTTCNVGSAIEHRTELFPNRTNVQFLKVIDRNNIAIQIWERGVGWTLASGTSSCATAAVAKKMGKCDKNITVHVPGGKIQIHLSDNYDLTMTGPVTYIGVAQISVEAFQFTL